jgi:hypothetical protein
MQPRLIRVMDQANWRYFKKLDAQGNPVLDFHAQEVRSLCKIFDYCEKNHITVMIGDWGIPGIEHDTDNPGIRLRNIDDTRFIRMIGDWVDFLLNVKGYTCIKYYDLINEPNGDWASTKGNFAEWALGIKLLHEEFVRRGLDTRISISGPGTVPQYTCSVLRNKYDGSQWMDYASEVLNRELGSYNTHAYFRHSVIRDGKAAEYVHLKKDAAIADRDGKPFFLGEIGIKASSDADLKEEHERRRLADGHTSGDCNMFVYDSFYGIDMASAAIQSLLAGVDGLIAWDLDDAMHTEGDTGDKNKLKRWGFWNILGTELHGNPSDEDIRPWYYAWSWLCRFMPQNTKLYEVEQPAGKGCQVLFARSGNDYSIYLVNTSGKDEKFRLKMPGNSESRLDMNILTYNERYKNSKLPYSVRKEKGVNLQKGFAVDLPAQTLTVLTTMSI